MSLEPNLLLSWIFLCIAATISSILFFFRKKAHKFTSKKLQHQKKKLPPGEMGLPWIGETMEFYKAQKSNRVFEDFLNPRIIKHGNLFKKKIMGSPTIVVNGAEANRLILSNEFNLVVSSWPSSSVQLMGMNCIMAMQGEKHRVRRGIVGNSLSYNGLESLVPKLCDTVRFHLETEWQGKEEISLYRSAKALTFTVVFECLYGIKVELEMLEIFERVLEGVFALPVEFPCSRFARAKKARLEIETLLVGKVREKRREMEKEVERLNKTLFSRLVEGLIKGEITEEEVVDNMVLLMFAAHDTTSYTMAMTFKKLAQHPTCRDTDVDIRPSNYQDKVPEINGFTMPCPKARRLRERVYKTLELPINTNNYRRPRRNIPEVADIQGSFNASDLGFTTDFALLSIKKPQPPEFSSWYLYYHP